MRTNFPQRNKKQELKRKIHQAILVVVILAALFFFGSFVRGLVQFINAPISAAKEIITRPFGTFFGYFASKSELVERNLALDGENKKLKIELLTVESLRRENDSLKDLLNYNQENPNNLLAKVLNRPPVSPYDTFVIDLGSDKVAVAQEVFYQNIPIGRIAEVYSGSAIVRIYSSSGEKIFVDIDEDLTNIEALGIGGGTFRAKIPKDLIIDVGAMVTLPGGVLLGQVEGIEPEPSDTFQNLYFRYPFKLSQIDWVTVQAD
ncbi:MAG TPA: rod shape-determining protein MreC [Candidatus Paceibacterota bacterium]|nr:rod shape-determining protein MreC [Candidatus Paceibacterota bacterium]HRZ34483.1 rod shape-determining protein MreC [Candidatus Paceibacterota bacterium]